MQVTVCNRWFGNILGYNSAYGNTTTNWSIFQGMLYLLYPIFGWIAEAYLSNFSLLKWSFIILLINSALAIILTVTIIVDPFKSIMFFGVFLICVTGFAIGLGMYEANAIQFGMDQMMDASSEQLSSFIHWYFWCLHVGALLIYYIDVIAYWYFANCKVHSEYFMSEIYKLEGWIWLVTIPIQFFGFCFGVVLVICYEKHFHIQQATRNPLKNVVKVVKYSYYHKYPERRSAFTYWENDIPSRIDLGKEKYGGPFTYEQVEDVKTFFRLILVMVSMFGYHISGDGYSIITYTMNTIGCPSIVPATMYIYNPQHISFLVASVGVPLLYLLQRCSACYKCPYYFKLPRLLTRLQIGLFICLLIEALHCIYSIVLPNNDFKCDETDQFHKQGVSVTLKCLAANLQVISNDTQSCHYFCTSPPVNNIIINLSVIIIILQGIAYLLVFMTMLEFICAQSPNSMKGILIGIWYSMLSIRVSIVNILDIWDNYDITSWNIYHGIKGVCIFVSLMLFSWVAKRYRYRERNEVVNEQAIIEEQYERELLMNESSEEESYNED